MEALCIILGMVFFEQGLELTDRESAYDRGAGLALMLANLALVLVSLSNWWLTKMVIAVFHGWGPE